MQWFTPGKDIDFMRYRPYFLGASAILVVASIIGFFNPGPHYGTDFSGGTELEVAFGKGVSAGQVRATVQKIGFASPDVVAVDNEDGKNQFLIRVKEVSAFTDAQKKGLADALCLESEEGKVANEAVCPQELHTTEIKFSPGGDKVSVRYVTELKISQDGDEAPLRKPNDVCGPAEPNVACPPRVDIAKQLTGKVEGVALRVGQNNPVVQNPRDNKVEFYFKSKGDQIMDGLRVELGEAVPDAPLRVEWIGPKAGKQLRDAAIMSISIAVIFIMVFIAFRFDMRFAPGSIAALIHDVFIAMGIMVVAQREVTLSTVAALLTIVGYSINDTVVVYDRIRENLGKYRKMSFPKIINRSVTEMLGRTIRTSGLTAAAVAPFLFWGTGVIKDFAFTLLIGVVVGTYSSIYVAAPVTELIDRRIFGKSVKKKRRVRRKKKGPSSSRAGARASV
ncbi:MAG: protein translocase subunit SecF [Deltaproteobacteria bacterium]|nr:MAG: protein translocase subunit SecF [Deltaproteobacteria bacterium]